MVFKLIPIFAAALAWCGSSVYAKGIEGHKAFAKASVESKSGSHVSGTIDFAQTSKGLLVKAHLENLSPGNHGFHIHAKGDCSAADASSAGDHFNPLNEKHGAPTMVEHHVGDFGNIVADQNGKADEETTIPNPKPGFDWHTIIGKAIILHEKNDDLTSQPSGNAGKRIGCGVIQAESSKS